MSLFIRPIFSARLLGTLSVLSPAAFTVVGSRRSWWGRSKAYRAVRGGELSAT